MRRFLWVLPLEKSSDQRTSAAASPRSESDLSNFIVFFRSTLKKGVKLRWLWWWVRPKAKNSNRPSHDERADSEEMDKSYWAVSFKSPKRLDQWAPRIITPQQKGRHAEEFQPNRQPILSQRQTQARPNFTQSKPTKKKLFFKLAF